MTDRTPASLILEITEDARLTIRDQRKRMDDLETALYEIRKMHVSLSMDLDAALTELEQLRYGIRPADFLWDEGGGPEDEGAAPKGYYVVGVWQRPFGVWRRALQRAE
jgi:hypothetical protein